MAHHPHVLIITFHTQGQLNPCVQFATKLIKMGVEITFSTSLSGRHRMPNDVENTKGFTTAFFSDGYDDGIKLTADDTTQYMSSLRTRGSECLKQMILSSAENGRPISCVMYTLLVPWAPEVAREMHVPSALLWTQPAAVLDIYYYYFSGYGESISNCMNDPSWSIQLPGLPQLCSSELPSFLLPTSPQIYDFILPSFKEIVESLKADVNTKVLVNSFDALEPEALAAIEKLKMVAIGPVLPSAFLDNKYPSSSDYIDWLDSKADKSVVYISFGSLSVLPKHQVEEIGRGLLKSGMPFLWVMIKKDEEEKSSMMKELEGRGMIVGWCNQPQVLSHPAVGCFVTHCGWNSTLESMVCKVPVVGFPQWTDQMTNAKLIEGVWKIGVRVNVKEEGVVDGDEVHRCLQMVMGSEEVKGNAKKWGDLAWEAISEGGSSDKNLKAFVEEIANV